MTHRTLLNLVIVAALASAVISSAAADVTTYTLRENLHAGQQVSYAVTTHFKEKSTSVADGESDVTDSAIDQNWKVTLTIAAVKDGSATQTKVDVSPDSVDTSKDGDQPETKTSCAFAGKTITLTRNPDETITSDFKAPNNPTTAPSDDQGPGNHRRGNGGNWGNGGGGNGGGDNGGNRGNGGDRGNDGNGGNDASDANDAYQSDLELLNTYMIPDNDFYPDYPVAVGDSWDNTTKLAKHLTLGPTDQMKSICKFDSVQTINGKTIAQVTVTQTTVYHEEDNVENDEQLTITLLIDLGTGMIVKSDVDGSSKMSTPAGSPTQVTGVTQTTSHSDNLTDVVQPTTQP